MITQSVSLLPSCSSTVVLEYRVEDLGEGPSNATDTNILKGKIKELQM